MSAGHDRGGKTRMPCGARLQAEVADAVVKGLQPLVGPAQSAHELAVVGESPQEGAAGSDTLRGCHVQDSSCDGFVLTYAPLLPVEAATASLMPEGATQC